MYPKEIRENHEYRRYLLDLARKDKGLQTEIRFRCAENILYWTNLFLWTYDPRKVDVGQNPNMQFVTWPFQDEAILKIQEHMGKRDIGIEKSRDMGASWICLLVILHQAQFHAGRSFMLVSRNETYVDSPGNPKCLFWKLDYMVENQPTWMVPQYKRTKMHWENLDLKSFVDGESSTGDVGRGARGTAILMDEFAAFEPTDGYRANGSTEANSKCRIFNSTYQGASGAFYEQMQRPNIVKISLHWTLHPEKNVGLVRDAKGKPWSPAYAEACERLIVPGIIAQEWDMDPAGAASMFFPADLLDRLKVQDARPPIGRYRVEFDQYNLQKVRLVEDDKGPLRLWMNLKPPHWKLPDLDEKFGSGQDVSAGTGATNSVMSVGSLKTREKIAELAISTLSPDRFADMCVALAYFFNNAYMIWERNGPGMTFGKRVENLGYANIYIQQDEKGLTHKVSKSLIPGWQSTPGMQGTKTVLFAEYVRALANGWFINRSREALEECAQYVYLPDGSIDNARARATQDPSGARQNHADRAVADALCNKALGPEPEMEDIRRSDDPFSAPPGLIPEFSVAGRRLAAMRGKSPGGDGWEEPAGVGWDESNETLRGW